MANKKTTLKTSTGDNVYPNVLDENIPENIVRDATLESAVTSLSQNIEAKQDKLTAGTNIVITGTTISATTSVPDNVVLYGELTAVK